MNYKIYKTILIFVVIIFVFAFTGCVKEVEKDEYPVFNKVKYSGEYWYIQIEETQYITWPDKSWLLLLDKGDGLIGYLESKDVRLYKTKGDPDQKYIKVSEISFDLIHVPLVKRELESEFSLDEIDAMEWLDLGIYKEGFEDELGNNIVDSSDKLQRFIELSKNKAKESGSEKWESAGNIFCYNDQLPNVVCVIKVEYFDGMLKCRGRDTVDYFLIPLDDLIEILGYGVENIQYN